MELRDNDLPASYLPGGSVVADRIAAIYPELSSALRMFADFVLTDPMRVVQLSINDTVHASGVSVATANRFARKLGFEGYAQFRSELVQGFQAMLAPVERLRRKISEGSTVHEIIAASLEEDIENIRETMQSLDTSRFEQAVDMLVNAERILLLAFDNAASLCNIFAHRLEMTGKHVIEAGSGKLAASRHLAHYGKNDLVVSLAFPRYIRDTVDVTRAVKKRDIPILAITDTQASPIASLGTLTLYIRARRTIGSTSDAAILSALEALAAGVSAKTPGAAETAQRYADFAYPWMIAE
ncbi:MAG: MurR/RpiR family transcriptional regulator [Rhizobiaceae bacterium]|nr:MurR/RpiR family transcriptional regulator [Rhizobiaceae bacterium]